MGIENVQRKGRRKNKEFMDAALDAYIRNESLARWRAYQALRRDEPGLEPSQALARVGDFAARGAYAPLWAGHWQAHVAPAAAGTPGEVFAAVEAAIRQAVTDERALRAERGETALEDLPDYNAFIRGALGRLFQEASGEIEEV